MCVFAACKAGFYKAFAGNIKCSKCPPHSFSHSEASALCHCEKGYYRAGKDPPSTACTRQSTSIYPIIRLDAAIALFSTWCHSTQSYIPGLFYVIIVPSVVLASPFSFFFFSSTDTSDHVKKNTKMESIYTRAQISISTKKKYTVHVFQIEGFL